MRPLVIYPFFKDRFLKIVILAQIVVFCLFAGCTEIKVKEDSKTKIAIKSDEKISFILDRSLVTDIEDAPRIELKIEKCIEKELKDLTPPIQVVTAETFRKTVFPDFDYLSVPSSPESILTLTDSAEFNKRIKQLGVRYLLVIHGSSEFSGPEIGGFGGYGGGVLIGIWDKQTKMSAFVLDLNNVSKIGDVKTEATGYGWFVFFGLGFGYPAVSEGPACHALGEKIATFITGRRNNK